MAADPVTLTQCDSSHTVTLSALVIESAIRRFYEVLIKWTLSPHSYLLHKMGPLCISTPNSNLQTKILHNQGGSVFFTHGRVGSVDG